MMTVVFLAMAAAWATLDPARLAKGRAIYEQACLACHGRDGRGNPEWENTVRPIAFSDCGTTSEATETWKTIVAKGGPARGLDAVMPAFEEAYNDEEIDGVVAYLRTFCPDADRYPPGDLNFRRLLRTGKAFPEQEVVLRTSHRPAESARETELEILYENRIGATLQYEVVVPIRASTRVEGEAGGIGDIEIEGKKVLAFDPKRLDILSAGVGLTLPTGRGSKGLGSGTLIVSPFLAYGKGWGRTFLQTQVGTEIPAEGDKASLELRYAVGLSHALGPPTTAFTPAMEFVGTYNTQTGAHEYAVWGEVSKPLNKLGHVIASAGAQVPIRPREAGWKLEFYLLWDFGDGPFWVGW
jgi:mono/diheme cytochrome c family protein